MVMRGLDPRIHDESSRKQSYSQNRGEASLIAGSSSGQARGQASGNDDGEAESEYRALGPLPRLAPSIQKISGIGDEPNDGAEHGRDQHAARNFIELVHAITMRRAKPAIKSQLNQNCPPRAPWAKPRITYFRNKVTLPPQSPLTHPLIPPLASRGVSDQRLQMLGRGAVAGKGASEMRRQFPLPAVQAAHVPARPPAGHRAS